MKHKIPRLLRAYSDGLLRYLKGAPDYSLDEARKVGESSLDLGMEPLDLAKLHQEALISLVPNTSLIANFDKMIRLAGDFFVAAVTPIEGSHQAVRKDNIQLRSTVDKLSKKTLKLAASNSALKAEIKTRGLVEASLRISKSTSSQLLMESLHIQEELRLLSRRLLVAQEEERKTISRELHDIVAQTLTSINVRLASLTLQTNTNSDGMHQKIATTQRLVEKSVDLVHRFARDLRPTVLDDLGLIPALESYLKDFMERSGIRATLTVFADVEELSSNLRTVLYRVAQEALINVAHHSKATNASVSIRKMKNVVRMEICDDGKGFEVSEPVQSQNSIRLGLLGMKERVEMVGCLFRVESELGKKTTIRVDIPRMPAKSPLTSDAKVKTSPHS